MTVAFRLSSGRYPANSGVGAARFGGRWNPIGTEVIYTASSSSLAILEILAHYSVLPKDFVLTTIEIPPRIRIFEFPDADLPEGWDKPKPLKATQKIGLKWVKQGQYPVMRVPSSIVRIERNLVLNPAHPDFRFITFQAPIPFRFDPRLKS